MNVPVGTLSVIGFLISGQLMLAGQSEPTRDDALVLAAVIEHTILPSVRNASSSVSRTPVAIVNAQSIPLCKERSTNQMKCAIPESWRMFLVPDAARNWPGLVPDDATRKQLLDSLERRNSEPHPLPVINNPDVVLLGTAASAATVENNRQRTVGSSSLSLPGYSDDRYALVYGSYSCGSLCGYAWLFVLEKSDGQWRVKSATVTSIA